MTIVAIDSSGPIAGIAVVRDDVLIAEYNVNYKKKHSQTLLPMLEEVMNMVEMQISQVDAIAVTAGPGSFTGLRIGSAMAKGLACALGKPIIPVKTLSALAWNMYGFSGIICPIMDARREQVYNALFTCGKNGIEAVTEQRAIAMRDVIRELNEKGRPAAFLGDGVPVYRDIIEEEIKVPCIFAAEGQDRQRASSVAAEAMRLFEEGNVVTGDEFRPVYLRKSQPEQAKEK